MSEFSKEQLEELIGVFSEEATRLADEFGQGLEEILDSPPEKVDSLIEGNMRVAHNLKGAASSVGFEHTEKLAHKLEDSLSKLKTLSEPITSTHLSPLKRAVGTIYLLIEHRDQIEGLDALLSELDAIKEGPQKSKKRRSTPQPKGQAKKEEETEDPTSQIAGSSSVRVEASTLDELMALNGELLSAKERSISRKRVGEELLERLQEIIKNRGSATFDQDFEVFSGAFEKYIEAERKETIQFSNLVGQIGATVKAARMLPLEEAAPFWRRVIREVSLEQNKDVSSKVDVGGIKIDRTIFDNLREPMMHLMRNAVDHGLEYSEKRLELGKPEEGRIEIRASLDRAMVKLDISDDGQGIDYESLRKRAIEEDLIDEGDAEEDPSEILALLFRDGFSTRKQASRYSGRGVGLSVVKRQIEGLGGTVDIRSPGRLGGTTFILSCPVSILSTKGLLVSTGQEIYAIPSDFILRTFKLDRQMLKQLDGEWVAVLEDNTPLKLAWLSSLLGYQTRSSPKKLIVVILETEDSKLGLIVSNIIGEQEFVTQRLPWNLKNVNCVAGAVPLAGGSPAIVLDIPSLIRVSKRIRGKQNAQEATQEKSPARILVVDDSLTARTIAQTTLLTEGYNVTLASHGQEAWQKLRSERFDLVVTDVEMPHMDGFELTRQIRGQAETKLLPVILVTKRSNKEDIAQGASAGADEYIVKGNLEQEKLLKAVRRLLQASEGTS